MKVALVTIIVISVCLCDATEIRNRRRRSISESTRYHNEYDQSDRRVQRPKSDIDNANEFSVSPPNPTQNCLPGTRWKQDCNSCFCTDKGFAACTLRGCLGFNNNIHQYRQNTDFHNSITQHSERHNRLRRSENNIEEVQPLAPPAKTCETGTRWKQDCNNCWCTETGVGVCTLMRCLTFDLKPHQSLTSNRSRRSSLGMTRAQNSTVGNETKCKHGTFRMEDCNRCRCLRGRYACTRMMCPVGERKTNMRANEHVHKKSDK